MGYTKQQIMHLLTGVDGNAFSIMGRTMELIRQYIQKKGIQVDIRILEQKFNEDAMAGTYDQLLRTCGNWLQHIEEKCDVIRGK